jgi:hypothetical protein
MNFPRKNFLISFLFLLSIGTQSCNSLDQIDENAVEFTEDQQATYLKINHPKNKEFLESIQSIEEKHESFSGRFSLRIDRSHPNKESFNAEGQIWFLKETGQMKIKLTDNFFGMVFSEVLAEPDRVRVRSAQSDSIHSQPMGDLQIFDPGKRKYITIPFPVIYYSITGQFLSEFRAHNSLFSPKEGRVFVKKKGDEFHYFFDQDVLSRIEWISEGKGVKAIASAEDKKNVPSQYLITKIVETDTDRQTVLIQTRLRSVRKIKPELSIFQL